MNRRTLLTALLAATSLAALLPACGPDKPRALILADGSGTIHAKAVDVRAKNYEKRTSRPVKILVVPAAEAIALASRGEADVAVVPMEASIDTFIASEHGKVTGLLDDHGDHLRVLEVDAKQHPKVDEKGAKSLAAALITPP
ncbi:MAG: hypothetical protein R3B70_31930 [Polyangiaceae bacterium]